MNYLPQEGTVRLHEPSSRQLDSATPDMEYPLSQEKVADVCSPSVVCITDKLVDRDRPVQDTET